MAKGSLSNQLLGRTVTPSKGLENVWRGLKENLSNELVATIDAAWIDEGSVKIAVHDPFGNVTEMYLNHVVLKEKS